MRSRPTCLPSLALAACLLLALPALALGQTAPNAESESQARALMTEGVTLVEAGDHAGALAKFEAAYAAVPSPKIRYNLALVLKELGRNAEAAEHFEAFLAEAPGAPAEARKDAEKELARLRPTLVKVAIEVDQPGAAVVVGGRNIGLTPVVHGVYVQPGTVKVEITKADFQPLTQERTARPGGQLTWTLRLVPLSTPGSVRTGTPESDGPAAPQAAATLPSAAAMPPAGDGQAHPPAAVVDMSTTSQSDRRKTLRTAGYVAAAAGATGLASGVILGIMTKARIDDLAYQYDRKKEETTKTLNTMQAVGYTVGIVGLGAAIVLAIIGNRGEGEVNPTQHDVPAPKIEINAQSAQFLWAF